ncbi:cytochrome P450 [Eremomyces bilateralis CBS 781.70]|uniref:Cytochrome P450 n=1 Tax=Eremomyces bilateralis CBS 781.70 TaxID=1392243 RepID=A0A6G1FSI2_9PEZI|nr:cytochrome P450 [Eremomyces bilateralis CBS 781.70]KAF1808680.1 cytochrome P450 [Eremomyces bilateralis CBS 781.70]
MEIYTPFGASWISFLATVSFCLLILLHAYRVVTTKPPIPDDVPWVGRDPSKWFGQARARLASFRRMPEWLFEGYQKYRSKPFAISDPSGKPVIILPRSDIKWLLDFPDDIISTIELHYEVLAGAYAFTDSEMVKEPFQNHVIHRSLSRRVNGLTEEIWDEITAAIDESWGIDTEHWKDVHVYNTMMFTISRVSNRVFVGLPLCRKEEFLRPMRAFAQGVMFVAGLLHFVPSFLKPIIGHVLAIPNHFFYYRGARYTVPIIKERLANTERKEKDPSFRYRAPNDYITWHIQLARAEGRHQELAVDRIARRIMPINFAAIHTTTFVIVNALFDILCSPPIAVEAMPESNATERKEGVLCSRSAIAKLTFADSCIRESMRVSNFMTRELERKVIKKDGVRHPGGWVAPYGAVLAVDGHSIHHDPSIQGENAGEFDALRFHRSTEPIEQRDNALDKVLKRRQVGMVTTSDSFLAFGHGRHACPGRFFVAYELKLLLAYIAMHYEMEPPTERPKNTWFGTSVLPPMDATIRVRRRNDESRL